MNILLHLHFFAFIIFLWLIIFILSKNPKAKINRVGALLLLCFAIWNFSYIFMHSVSSKNNAMIWMNISSLGWISFASFYLWFILIFTGKEKILKNRIFYLVIFFAPNITYLQAMDRFSYF